MDVYDYYITPDEYAEAERNGIKSYTVERRIRNSGWAKQKAITTPQRVFKDHSHMKIVWVHYGISYDLFRSRLDEGWDEWSAATVPIRNSEDVLEHCAWMSELRRKYPRKIIELAD